MHSRSIEFGKKFNVPIHVRNSASFSDEPGTIIGSESESADRAVSGAALTKNEAQITIAGVPDQPGTSYAIFSKLAGVNVAVDMIVQNAGADGSADISFTVLEDDLPKGARRVEKGGRRARRRKRAARRGNFEGFDRRPRHGHANGRGRPHVPRAGRCEGINIEAITTSEIKVSVLVKRDQALAALRAVHSEFELDKPPRDRVKFGEVASAGGKANPLDIVARLAADGRPRDRKRLARRIAGSNDAVRRARSARHLGPHLSKRSPPRASWST